MWLCVIIGGICLLAGIIIGVNEGKEIGARIVMVELYGETAVQYAEVKFKNFKEVLQHLRKMI